MKHLWLAILEGTVEHRRALLQILGVIAGVLLLVHVVFYFASSSTAVCSTCHIMDPYVEAWKASTHKDVACVRCHSEWRLLMSSTYLKYAVGLYSTQLRAEVPDTRCLGCHERQDLDTDKPFLKNIHFSHKAHLGEARRGKRLHCTSCHSGTGVTALVAGQATHVSVDESVCFTCHFKGAEKGQAVTGCLVCHGPPSKVVTHQGLQFDHASYLKRDVRCGLCHVEVTRGDANVPRERCASCHVSRIEAYEDSERVHAIHLQRREIDCKRCHNRMEHGKFAMAPALGERCDACHKPTHTQQEQMYIGIGGQGVPDTPSTMFLARVACDSCHGEPNGDPRTGAEQLRKSCVTCHGPGFDRMVDDWISEVGGLVREVEEVVVQAQAQLGREQGGTPRSQLARARHNLDFIRSARGEHNIRYAVELLRVARADAEEALRSRGLSAPPRPVVLTSAAGYCQVCHSTSHLGTRLPFSGLEYDHNRHLASGLSCERCHSLEDHGKTTITRDGCMSCHHGKDQKRTCEGCHPQQAALYRGQLAGTSIKGDPDVMAQAEVGCEGCHDLTSREPLIKGVQKACVGCHEKGYDELVVQWINEDQQRVQELAVLLVQAEARLGSEGGSGAAEHRQSLSEAKRIHSVLIAAKGAHNGSLAADAAKRARELLAWAAAPSH